MTDVVSEPRSKNTAPKPRKARTTVAMGVVTSTAPKVPPNTIMAAVPCATSCMLPFSRIRPPMMPAIASAMPEMVAMSGRRPEAFEVAGAERAGASAVLDGAVAIFAMGSVGSRFASGDGLGLAIEHAPAEFYDPLHHLIGALAHAQNLPVGESDNGVRGHVDMLNQIRVEYHLRLIQAG